MSSDNILRVPVKPSMKPCSECGKAATKEKTNLQYTLAGITGVLCRDCLQKEIAAINAKLEERPQ